MTDRPNRRRLDDGEFLAMVARIDERTENTAKDVVEVKANQSLMWDTLSTHRNGINDNQRRISNLRSWFSGAIAVIGVVGLVIVLYQFLTGH